MRKALILAAVLFSAWYPATTATADVIDATCRITNPDGSRGTGIAFEHSQGQVWILTNAHVAGSASAVKTEWWHRGHAGMPVSGRVVMRSQDPDRDVAVVAVAESAFQGRVPPTVPMAPRGTRLPPGTPVMSVGSANGTWPTLFRGHVIRYEGTSIYFTPPPANGRSGSGVVSEDGSQIVGVLFARGKDQPIGLAVSSEATYQALSGRTSTGGPRAPPGVSTALRMPEVQISRIPAQQPFRYRLPLPGVQRRLFEDGYRQGQQCPGDSCPTPGGNSGGSGGVWPTLPPASGQQAPQYTPLPQQPGMDIGSLGGMVNQITKPITESLDRIEGSLDELASEAEARRQQQIVDGVPEDAREAIGRAVGGDVSGALDAATSDPMLGWLGQVIVWGLGALGVGGLPLLAIRFGVPLGLRIIRGRLRAAFHTETDDVVDDLADRVAGKVAANGRGRK